MAGEERLLALRQIMSSILKDLHVAEHDKASLLRGLNNLEFKDIEDGCQYELAEKIPCELLLTFNTADYPLDKESSVKALSPEEYLDACSKLY